MYSPSVRHMMKLVEKEQSVTLFVSNYMHIFHIGQDFGNKIRGLVHANKVDLRGKCSRIFATYVQNVWEHSRSKTIKRHILSDETLAETSVIAIGETENKIPVLLNGISGIGQEEELSYIVYGTKGVLKLRNWSELSVAQKDSPFEILTSFDSVKTLVEECILAIERRRCTSCAIFRRTRCPIAN